MKPRLCVSAYCVLWIMTITASVYSSKLGYNLQNKQRGDRRPAIPSMEPPSRNVRLPHNDVHDILSGEQLQLLAPVNGLKHTRSRRFIPLERENRRYNGVRQGDVKKKPHLNRLHKTEKKNRNKSIRRQRKRPQTHQIRKSKHKMIMEEMNEHAVKQNSRKDDYTNPSHRKHVPALKKYLKRVNGKGHHQSHRPRNPVTLMVDGKPLSNPESPTSKIVITISLNH